MAGSILPQRFCSFPCPPSFPPSLNPSPRWRNRRGGEDKEEFQEKRCGPEKTTHSYKQILQSIKTLWLHSHEVMSSIVTPSLSLTTHEPRPIPLCLRQAPGASPGGASVANGVHGTSTIEMDSHRENGGVAGAATTAATGTSETGRKAPRGVRGSPGGRGKVRGVLYFLVFFCVYVFAPDTRCIFFFRFSFLNFSFVFFCVRFRKNPSYWYNGAIDERV